MALLIKRFYDLIVLRLTLFADGQPPTVRFDLEIIRDHESRVVASWDVTTEALGLPPTLDCDESRGAGYTFQLPPQMRDGLRDALQEQASSDGPGLQRRRRPLWLHLTKPYGYLGLVPWEQLLLPWIEVPVLRLPDFIVEPVRSRQTIDVVVCASDPGGDIAAAAGSLSALAATAAEAVSLRTTVHLFTSDRLFQALRERAVDAFSGRVLLYDPAGAPPVPATDTDNVWFGWIRQQVQGRSIDIVHFVAPGVLQLGQGAIGLPELPNPATEPRLRVLSTGQLTRFTLQVGAWACVFSSPLGNQSEMGLRLAADTLAQLRPMMLLHHEMRLDLDNAALAKAYRLLTRTQPGDPPQDPSVFLYCQPFQIDAEPRKHELLTAGRIKPVAPTDKVRSLVAGPTATPTWVSASQRYVEQYEWQLNRWQATGASTAPEDVSAGVTRALELIQGVVDRYADTPAATPPPTDTAPPLDISTPRRRFPT